MSILAAKRFFDSDGFGAGGRAHVRRHRSLDEALGKPDVYRLARVAGVDAADERSLAAFAATARLFPFSKPGKANLPTVLRQSLYEKVDEKDLPVRAIRVRKLLALPAEERGRISDLLRSLIERAAQQHGDSVALDLTRLHGDVSQLFDPARADAVRRRWATLFYTATLPTEDGEEDSEK